jgi:hypothetical protein
MEDHSERELRAREMEGVQRQHDRFPRAAPLRREI